MSTVYSFVQAIENDCQPKEYPFQDEYLREGTFIANLDFKIWSKNQMAIQCYFIDVETQQKFQLSVYRQPSPLSNYFLKDCDLDFKECPIGVEYEITIWVNSKGNYRFTHAKLL